MATCPTREAMRPLESVSARMGNGEAPNPDAPAETTHAKGYSSTRRRMSASHLESKIIVAEHDSAGSQPVVAPPMTQDFDALGEACL